MSTKKCWATLLTKTSYLVGALVLEQSLREVGSAYPFVVFATPSLGEDARSVLKSRNIPIVDIAYLEPKNGDGKYNDERFRDTWTKLRVFELYDYERVVLLDADMLTVRNMDELMTMDLEKDWIAAGHACTCNPRKISHYPEYWIPENCAHTKANLTTPIVIKEDSPRTYHSLNSGLVILHPSKEAFTNINNFLQEKTPEQISEWIFPDQDLLADFFKGKFKPLGYQYNALKMMKIVHRNCWRDEDVKNYHFILDKPWNTKLPVDESGTHGIWWDGYEKLQNNWGDTPGWEIVAGPVTASRI